MECGGGLVTGKQCPEYAQLQAAVLEILEKIAAIATAQLRAFQDDNPTSFGALDKALETAVGEKERRIGAMRQHELDHKCHEHRE